MKIVPRSIEHILRACLASATWTYDIDDLYLHMRPVEHMILLSVNLKILTYAESSSSMRS